MSDSGKRAGGFLRWSMADLGRVGAALGMLAGLLEITVGASIREAIGNKENPMARCRTYSRR